MGIRIATRQDIYKPGKGSEFSIMLPAKHYDAAWLDIEENDIEPLKGLPEFERAGGYNMLGEELSEQGYLQSYGQLRTIDATSKQIKRIVKREGFPRLKLCRYRLMNTFRPPRHSHMNTNSILRPLP